MKRRFALFLVISSVSEFAYMHQHLQVREEGERDIIQVKTMFIHWTLSVQAAVFETKRAYSLVYIFDTTSPSYTDDYRDEKPDWMDHLLPEDLGESKSLLWGLPQFQNKQPKITPWVCCTVTHIVIIMDSLMVSSQQTNLSEETGGNVTTDVWSHINQDDFITQKQGSSSHDQTEWQTTLRVIWFKKKKKTKEKGSSQTPNVFFFPLNNFRAVIKLELASAAQPNRKIPVSFLNYVMIRHATQTVTGETELWPCNDTLNKSVRGPTYTK